jgi:hypothetical protein
MSEKAISNLRDRLDEFRKAFESGAPPYNAPHEAIEKMHRATAELKTSGIEAHALKVGDHAPSFTLFNQKHVEVSSSDSSDEDRWLSASSGDTGDLIAIWSWRLYKESILKAEHWERRNLLPWLRWSVFTFWLRSKCSANTHSFRTQKHETCFASASLTRSG